LYTLRHVAGAQPDKQQIAGQASGKRVAVSDPSWLVNEAGTIALYYAFPVYSDEQRQALLGHGLIKLDFTSALLRRKHSTSPTPPASVWHSNRAIRWPRRNCFRA
jgi:hypothetical protein